MLTDRRRKLAVIHIAKKELGLNDDTYRMLLAGAAGVDSAGKILNDRQYCNVMRAFRAAGYQPKPPAARKAPDAQMGKCYALWCELERLGAVKSKAWGSMMAWVGRQLGGHQDIIRANQKSHLIEELKRWQRRVLESSESGGNDD